MNDFTTSVITTLFIIGIGFTAKCLKLLDVKTTRTLYKFLFAIPLPIVVFTSLANSEATAELLKLPLIGALIAVSLVFLSFVIGKLFGLDRKTLGTLMTAAGITSTLSFALPFILVFYGQENAKFLFLYDFGGAVIVWTFVYYISGIMGNKRGQKFSQSIMNLVKAPMLWALILGLLISFTNISIPAAINSISTRLSGFVSVLILLGIGVFFNLDFFKYKKNIGKILLGIVVTMGFSVLLALLFTSLLDITGINSSVLCRA
jgi:malate permease and related proteins